MLEPSRIAAALVIALACLPASSTAQVTEYAVGIWYPTTPENVMGMYKPLFQDYLNREVGSEMNVRFRVVVVDLEEELLAEKLIDANKLDFLCRIACVERAFDWIVLATGRSVILGQLVGAQNTIIYSLRTNTDIQTIADFKRKRIGLALIHSPSYFMSKQVIASHGVDLFKDTAQLVFYANGYEDQLDDVLKEKIDAGIISGTYLFQKFPDKVPYLRLHNVINASWESVPFPFPTSAPLAPTYTLACSPQIPYLVKRAVERALMVLDVNSPEAKAAALANFTTAGSFFDTRGAMEAANLFDANGRCVSPFADMRTIMNCPKGFALDSDIAIRRRCADNHHSCPEGYPCYCNVCIPNTYVTVFPGEVVLGFSTALFGMNLAVILFWGFGLEVANCLRRPIRRVFKTFKDAMRKRAVPQHRG